MAKPALILSIAQLNTHVGALHDNAAKIQAAAARAVAAGAHVLLVPEMALTGYPLLDLARRADFVAYASQKAKDLAKTLPPRLSVIFGGIEPARTPGPHGQLAHNSMFVAHGGRIVATSRKGVLPIAGEFDEPRLYRPGRAAVVEVNGVKLGLPVCEDMWHPAVCAGLARRGAQVLLVANASPAWVNGAGTKPALRHAIAAARVQETGLPLAYVNMVGGQDEFVFDGASFCLNPPDTAPAAALASWEETETLWSLENTRAGLRFAKGPVPGMEAPEYAFKAAVTGLKDYVRKTGGAPGGLLLGMSGGVDSALAGVIAVEAVGAKNVKFVRLPTPYTSRDSMELAAAMAKNLGVVQQTVEIWPAVETLSHSMATARGGKGLAGLATENIQSRMRMNVLMSLANDENRMVVGTGNWSEMSMGYTTVGGDSVCGLNVLKGMNKTLIYAVCAWLNQKTERIPAEILTRAPSAELREGQKDEDSLPPYQTVLDPILEAYTAGKPVAEIVAMGFEPATVARIVQSLHMAQWKRSGPRGLNIMHTSYDRKWDYPIALHPEGYLLGAWKPQKS